MRILPDGCVLTRVERDVFYETHVPEADVPCVGCWKREQCPARMDKELNTALLLMEEDQRPLKTCRRCGAKLVEWSIEGSTRQWECSAMVPDSNGNRFQCGWTLSEVPFSLDKHR